MTKSLSKEKYIGSITKISSVGKDAKGLIVVKGKKYLKR